MSLKKCSHCQLKFEENSMIKKDNLYFCCTGCENVYEIVHNQGFEEFYSRLGKSSLSPVNLEKKSQNIENLYKNYVKNEDGFSKINLIIEGMHCSACIWLNEKVLFSINGILEVNINATNNKATIVWDDSQIGLGEILSKINSIGYIAYAYDSNKEESIMNAKRREFYIKLLVGIFVTMNIMWIAIAQYSGYFLGMDKDVKDLLNFAEFILATPVLFYTGSTFFAGYKVAFKSKTPNMDMLVATGASLAYFYSVYAMFSRQGEVYFDSVAMIITFVFVGKFLEVLSKKKANDTIDSLNSMLVSEVIVKENGEILQKNIDEVKVGDLIVLKAGDKVLIDGVLESGEANFDYARISGESLPVFLSPKDSVKSGSICLDGYVEYRASLEFKNSLLNKIITLLENANFKKPHIQTLANKISAKFSLSIILIALITFVFWYINLNFESSLIIAISVIVIACPCALALATPISTLVALGVGLKKSIIFKESKIIETLAKCDTAVFDKTGTLTKGKLSVFKFDEFLDFDLRIVLALAKGSKHPVSVAVAKFLNEKGIENIEIPNIKEIASKGVGAKFEGKNIIAGSSKFMLENGVNLPEFGDMTEYFVAIDGILAFKFSLNDEIKDGALECIRELKDMKFEIYMLTGDNDKVAKNVALELGISNFKASLLPNEKAEFIEQLQKKSKKVLIVGDGINDSLAMSYAEVAVCMGSGADVSIERSDIVLLNDDLVSLKNSIKIAKYTLLKIKQNLAFSLLYNLITLPLAVLGYVIPLFAAISMSFSSIVVILNSLQIKNKFKG